LIIGRGVTTSPPVWVGRLPMGVDAARLKIEFCYHYYYIASSKRLPGEGDLGKRNTGLQLLRDLTDLQKNINEDIELCLRN
jgi:hypothetical protein